MKWLNQGNIISSFLLFVMFTLQLFTIFQLHDHNQEESKSFHSETSRRHETPEGQNESCDFGNCHSGVCRTSGHFCSYFSYVGQEFILLSLSKISHGMFDYYFSSYNSPDLLLRKRPPDNFFFFV